MWLEVLCKVFSCIPYVLKFDWASVRGLFNNQGYCFKEYKKHVTVYRNGNGIVINTFKIKVFDPAKVDNIYRRMNIEDGKITSNFPSLKEMRKTNIDDRFNLFGFWFRSDDKIVTKAQEFYWSEYESGKEDYDIKNNPKEIRWKFLVDEGKIKRGKEYTVTYVMSIPGMFPIEKGYYNKYLHDEKYEKYNFSSSMKVDHSIKKLIYTVSFENGVRVDESPRCKINKRGKNSVFSNKKIHGIIENNYIYNKYTYIIKNPKFQSRIKVNWGLEEKSQKTTKKS